MPRKDGSPTAGERKNAERIERNRRFILEGGDISKAFGLEVVRAELAGDAEPSSTPSSPAGRPIDEA